MKSISTISQRAFMDEAEAMQHLLAQVSPLAALEKTIMAQAKQWTNDIRAKGAGHGVEAFLHAYSLNTEEGVALMCLAEALLRIPDTKTADALIRDTFEHRHWERYTGSDSWLVNMSSWGLLLTGKVMDVSDSPGILQRLIAKMGEPVIREALKKAMSLIGGQFVLGETMKEALAKSKTYQGYRFSFDILGEGARELSQALGYVESYKQGIALIGKTVPKNTPLFAAPGISVKLSALHPRYQLVKRERVMAELLPRLKSILLQAKEAGIAVSIDAEESSRLDMELMLFERILAEPEFTGWNGIGFVLQAYQKRAFYIIDWLAELARKHARVIPVRLVKGAYWDSEIKWAQMLGLPSYPVFTRKENTDVSYLACAQKLLTARKYFYPQFATHNARTVASIMALAAPDGSYEFQRLPGMGEALHDVLLAQAPSRIYAPVGAHKDLLAYLIRRLLENGANSSFVHVLMDGSKTPEEILADPIAAAKKPRKNPIPLPEAIYGNRKNSAGVDFGNAAMLQDVQQLKPASLAPVADDTLQALDKYITAAARAFPAWTTIHVETRAAILEKAAELIEGNRAEFLSLLASEAGKTLPDAIAEIREAADFCRYYAQQARALFTTQNLTSPAGESNRLMLHPRGVFACLSPWNFPLAIFVGQVAAALATGNCVIAKPAEQTPRIARRAVELLLDAGIPKDVLQLAVGAGDTIGAALVADGRIDGVVFTGGTDTAKRINQTLANRKGAIVPLIAETGGQNCMVVDSSALLEQAVDDIILSAFGSAGQRCSALRVLFVQEDIADALLALLAGAMQELTLGDALDVATDIGPVIDAQAKDGLLAHIETMKKTAKLVAEVKAPQGRFVAPHVFEINNIAQLQREVFGPVLHVVRFRNDELAQLPDVINSTGYGLTFGIHSRVEEHIALLSSRVRAGNIYVNRSMIGAVVGVQPFGGEGLSGTGPKAGGPHYLLRFVAERTLTVNISAIGGNIGLLASYE